MPKIVGVNESFGMTILKDRLCLYGGRGSIDGLDIWIMEQDGWKWLMNIWNLSPNCMKFVHDRKLLWCSENDGILFHDRFPMPLMCLDSLYFPGLNIKEEATSQNLKFMCSQFDN